MEISFSASSLLPRPQRPGERRRSADLLSRSRVDFTLAGIAAIEKGIFRGKGMRTSAYIVWLRRLVLSRGQLWRRRSGGFPHWPHARPRINLAWRSCYHSPAGACIRAKSHDRFTLRYYTALRRSSRRGGVVGSLYVR